jgi:hypothetical protein
MRFNTLILAATLFAATASATDFKGIELGQSYTNEELQAKAGYDLGYGLGNSVKCVIKTYCSGQVHIGNGLGEINFTKAADGTMAGINVSIYADDFATVDALVKEKYGKPTSAVRIPMQNAFGAKVVNLMEDWKLPNGDQVHLVHYVDMEKGAFSIESARSVKEAADYRASHAKAGSL